MAANSLINCKPRTRMRNMRKRQVRREKYRMQAMMANIGMQDSMANIGMQATMGNIGMQDRMANTGMQARVGNIGVQGRNPSELGVLSPASLTFRNSVIDRFGPVPPIQGSLNSMIQTMSGTNSEESGVRPTGRNPSELGVLSPALLKFRNSVIDRFGPVPPIQGSLNSMIQTMSGTNREESGVRPTDMNPPQSCDRNQPSNVCNQSSGLNIDVEEDFDISFPGLIIFKGIGKQYKGINFLKKSFINSQYGPLTVTKIRSGNMSKASAWACGKCLVVGQGLTGEEAEHEAGYKLLRKLRKTNYYLEAKGTYIPMKKFPDCVRHVDPSLSHIYKVVFLQTPDGPEFPHTIEGAIDYVSSFAELISYIINHGQSGSKADLFILNIDKSQRTAVYQACKQIGMKGRPVVGCSDRGVVADYLEDCRQVFEDLKKCGGETIKYRLYPPSGDDEIIDLTDEKEKSHVDQEGTAPEQTASEEQEDLVISPWIAQNLIIMETFNEISWLESPKEIIFQSVKSCPALEEFIIEKKTDRVSKMITAEALIDKQVVGSATSYIEKLANERAAEDALKNLRKHCPSIEVKQDYLGARRTMPPPCILNRFKSKNNIFWVVKSNEVNNEYEVNQLFKHFWNTPFEDLFFLEDFAPNERELIYQMSKNHGLRARLFGNKCVCVYKNKTPREVFKQLMHTKSKENEKYKLHLPPAKPKPPVATTSQTLNETRETKIKSLFDFKQTGKTVKNQFSSSNIFDLASHTVSQGGPFNSGLLNLNESATDRSGNTEETMGNLQVNQTDPSQIPEVQLWGRRKYSSYPEKRSYSEAGLDDGTKSEYKSPKMSFNNEHFIQQRYPTGERSGCRETGPDSSACLDKSSNLIESNSRVESVDPVKNKTYFSELDVWMETEPVGPPMSNNFSESRQNIRPGNHKHLFDVRSENRSSSTLYENNKNSIVYDGRSEQFINRNPDERVATYPSNLFDTKQPGQQWNKNAQTFNRQHHFCNPSDQSSGSRSSDQHMVGEKLWNKNSAFTGSTQSTQPEKQRPVETRVERDMVGEKLWNKNSAFTGSNQSNQPEKQRPVENRTERDMVGEKLWNKNSAFTGSTQSNQPEKQRPVENRVERPPAVVNQTSSGSNSNAFSLQNEQPSSINKLSNPEPINNQCGSINKLDSAREKSANICNLFDMGSNFDTRNKQTNQDSNRNKISQSFEKSSGVTSTTGIMSSATNSSKCISDNNPHFIQQNDQFWAQHFKNVYDQWPKAKDYFQSNVNDDIDLCNKDSQSLQPRQFVNKLFDLPSVYNKRTDSEISEQNYSRSSVSESDKIRHSDNMDKLKNNEKQGQFGQVEVNESNVSGTVFRGSGWKESDKQKPQQCNNEKYSSLGQPDIFDTPDGTPLLHSSQMEEQPWASPSGGWDIEPKDYAFDEGPGRGEPKKVEQQKHKDLNSSVRPSNHKVPTPPPPPAIDRVEFERLFQESYNTFSNLFDVGPGRKSDICTLAQETSGKNKNQSYDRGNSSRFLDSTLREHSKQQTHTYWKDNIKRAYDQRQPETNRKSESNFSTHQNVGRSQGPQNSRFHSNRNRSRDRRETNRRTNYRRSPDRRERKREQDFDRNTNRDKERRVADRRGRY